NAAAPRRVRVSCRPLHSHEGANRGIFDARSACNTPPECGPTVPEWSGGPRSHRYPSLARDGEASSLTPATAPAVPPSAPPRTDTRARRPRWARRRDPGGPEPAPTRRPEPPTRAERRTHGPVRQVQRDGQARAGDPRGGPVSLLPRAHLGPGAAGADGRP